MEISLETLSEKDTYALLTQTIIPRPIAWVLTENHSNQTERWNLAPFSFFNGISSKPPMVMFSVGSWDVSGKVKDTLANIRANNSFTIGISSSSQVKHVQSSAIELPYGQSELTEFDIPIESWDWPTPRIKDCKINFACTLGKEIQIEDSSQILVFCRIQKIWIDDSAIVIDDKERVNVDPIVIDPLLRLGAGKYGKLGQVIPNPLASQ